ncbi:hypothetical protein MRX96_022973 [Rhipicephalus microplus]
MKCKNNQRSSEGRRKQLLSFGVTARPDALVAQPKRTIRKSAGTNTAVGAALCRAARDSAFALCAARFHPLESLRSPGRGGDRTSFPQLVPSLSSRPAFFPSVPNPSPPFPASSFLSQATLVTFVTARQWLMATR